MKKLTFLFALLVLIIAIHSCNKNTGERHFTIDKDLFATFNYQPGTYWIYKDSLTGYIDSMYVISSTGIISTDYGKEIVDNVNISIGDTNIYPGNIARRKWFLGMQSNNVSFGRNFQYGSVSFPWQIGYRSSNDPVGNSFKYL